MTAWCRWLRVGLFGVLAGLPVVRAEPLTEPADAPVNQPGADPAVTDGAASDAPLLSVGTQPLPRAALLEALEHRFGYLFLSSLALEELILQRAEAAGVSPTAGEIETEFDRVMQEQFAYSDARYQRWLTEFGHREADLRREIRVQVAQFKLRSRGVATDEATLRAWFDEHPELYRRPAAVAFRRLLVPWDAGLDEAGYRRKAEAMLARLRGGADFDTMLDEQAHIDPSVASVGTMTVVPAAQLAATAAVIDEAIRELEPGQVAAHPVWFGDAFYLVQLINRVPAQEPNYERQRRRVEIDYYLDKLQSQDEFLQNLLAEATLEVLDPRYQGVPLRPVWISRTGLSLPGWLRETW